MAEKAKFTVNGRNHPQEGSEAPGHQGRTPTFPPGQSGDRASFVHKGPAIKEREMGKGKKSVYTNSPSRDKGTAAGSRGVDPTKHK